MGLAFYTTPEVEFIRKGDENSLAQLAYLDLNPVSPAPHLDSADFNKNFDEQVDAFLEKWSLKGASVAVMKHNKLIYAKGYGYADVAKGIETENFHLMRIASASKLITAIAIMKLAEEDKLSLEDKVFGSDGILSDYDSIRDKKHIGIQVKHLLNHKGGWSWRDGDFMFQAGKIQRIMQLPGSPDAHDIIEFVLQKRRLRYKPGTQYAYSNFGYLLLGEIIQETTGQQYEKYVKDYILEPYGIKGMHLAGNYEWDRHHFETHYYDYPTAYKYPTFDGNYEEFPKPYGGNDVKTLGAAGGWIANASQLVTIASLIDPTNKYNKILSDKSIEAMVCNVTQPSDAYGWKGVDGDNWWRTGTLAGSSSFLYRREDGYTYAIIFNASVWMGHRFKTYIKHMMDNAIQSFDDRPTKDYMWQTRPEKGLLPEPI